MIGLAGAVYPQVIQRIYAAKSVKVLRQSLGAMVFMPLLTVLILFLLGVISIPHFQDQQAFATDAVLPEMLRVWGLQSSFTFALTVLVLLVGFCSHHVYSRLGAAFPVFHYRQRHPR